MQSIIVMRLVLTWYIKFTALSETRFDVLKRIFRSFFFHEIQWPSCFALRWVFL